jgi:hypothetical protein
MEEAQCKWRVLTTQGILILGCRKILMEQYKIIFNGEEVSLPLHIVPHFTSMETSTASLSKPKNFNINFQQAYAV